MAKKQANKQTIRKTKTKQRSCSFVLRVSTRANNIKLWSLLNSTFTSCNTYPERLPHLVPKVCQHLVCRHVLALQFLPPVVRRACDLLAGPADAHVLKRLHEVSVREGALCKSQALAELRKLLVVHVHSKTLNDLHGRV